MNTIFVLAVGALAVAFAISFGIGSREFAKKALEKLVSILHRRQESDE